MKVAGYPRRVNVEDGVLLKGCGTKDNLVLLHGNMMKTVDRIDRPVCSSWERKEYPWLVFSCGRRGCRCAERRAANVADKGFHHENSSCLLKALSILEQRDRENIPQYNVKMHMKVEEETRHLFRTAYKIDK
ncbi:hypothetical protein NDU88_011065 [Pleurodeles waltl]|uniref:Uncharacterized protein n=1 Tax=Pleurodeles waltl TaxID=8319 RepID=A0AAV7PWM8_PLEWA|nr:hypothetical protein NDU88_011065 [Pleurodeles waltl]